MKQEEYSLALLIILVILCWPAAILYYFTRPKIIRYEGYPPQQQYPPQNQPYQQPPNNSRFCTQCGRMVPNDVKFCPNCGKELS